MRQFEIVDAPARRLFAVPHRGPYAQIGPAFGRLADLLAEHGLTAAAGERVGVHHDTHATATADLRAHAGATLDETVGLPAGLDEVRLAAGRHAVLRVAGPYAGLQPADVWLCSEGLAAAGLDPAGGPSYEVYRDTPPDALITEIFVPIASRP